MVWNNQYNKNCYVAFELWIKLPNKVMLNVKSYRIQVNNCRDKTSLISKYEAPPSYTAIKTFL